MTTKGLWVRLYLERQSEASFMPPYVVGYLTSESAGSYTLTKVMEYKENDSYQMEGHIVDKHTHVNKTYVWQCEVLGEKPPIDNDFHDDGEGGLG